MSVKIENTDQLTELLKELDLKVTSVDELRQLLATINVPDPHKPEEDRRQMAKHIGTVVPGVMAAAAACVSFFVVMVSMNRPGGEFTRYHQEALAWIWGVCGVVSVTALIASFIMSRGGRASADRPPMGNPSIFDERVTAAIRRDRID